MDYDNLIEQYRQAAIKWGKRHPVTDTFDLRVQDALRDAATALSTLQAENEKLRAELEQVKRERNAAVKQLHGICSACKNYSPYHNKGKCRSCLYESARDKYAEVNDNWEWRGQKED